MPKMILYNQGSKGIPKTYFPIDFSIFLHVYWKYILALLLIKYNHESYGDNAILDYNQPREEALQPILHEEVEIAVASLKKNASLLELIISQQNLFKLVGRSLLMFNRDL